MQSRIVDVDKLKKEFKVQYKVLVNSKQFNEHDLLNHLPIMFELSEEFSGDSVGNSENDYNSDDYDSCVDVCVKAMDSYLETQYYTLSNAIETINNNLFYRVFPFFKDNAALNDLVIKRSKLLTLKHDKDLLKSLVQFNFNNIADNEVDIKIPFYRFSMNQVVYAVVQDPMSYLKIEKSIINNIFIVDTKTDNVTNCDYEFDYELSQDTKSSKLTYGQFRKFDGKKCIINYNYAIFTDLDDAKKHCIKVLNAIKDTVDKQIKDVEDFLP